MRSFLSQVIPWIAAIAAAFLAGSRTQANFSRGAFGCTMATATTWRAGTDPAGCWYGTGYDTSGSVADLTYAGANAGDERVLLQGLAMPAAGTYSYTLRARFSSPSQKFYWHILLVSQGTSISLTANGVPRTVTQAGVKSLTSTAPPSQNATGAWVAYTGSFTISAADVAAYQYVVVALVSSRQTGYLAQFDDVYTDLPAVAGDAAAGLKAEWFNIASGVSSFSQITFTSPVKTTYEENINYINRSANPFVPGVRADSFAVKLTGTLRVPTTGSWTFSLGSDDGSSMVLNGVTVFAGTGLQSFATRAVTVTLTAGVYPIDVRFFENTGSQGLVLSWKGPGMAATEVIPASAFQNRLRVARWRPVSADE